MGYKNSEIVLHYLSYKYTRLNKIQTYKYLRKESFGLYKGFAKLKISKIKKYIFQSYLRQTFYVL